MKELIGSKSKTANTQTAKAGVTAALKGGENVNSIITFPALYKKTSTGAIQRWQLEVHGNTMIAIHGQHGGKQQRSTDVVRAGKNFGRSNETTPEQQAQQEAGARFLEKKKSGYVVSLALASAGEVDTTVIEGGINPMLAQSYAKQSSKIKFPCAVQPKLDGHRCIAIIKDGKVSLWSRTRKAIHSCPHIVSELQVWAASQACGKAGFDFILDGELYNHAYKSNFEQLTSLIRKDEPAEGCRNIQYHVYDLINDSPFRERWDGLKLLDGLPSVRVVHTQLAHSDDDLKCAFADFLAQGYEGAMARNLMSPYENKRSNNLQKIKEFDDAEFKIIGIEEGRGQLIGHAGSCTCLLPDGRTFSVKMAGETSKLKEAFKNPTLWLGKLLTVKFQGRTSAGLPRFPVGLRLRDSN